MIDPLKEPVLSLLLSEECKVEVLPLLQALPLSDINRSLLCSSRHTPRLYKEAPVSVLETFLIQNRSHLNNDKDSPIKSQIALELVNQGASLSNTGLWEDGKRQWDILDLAFNYGHYKFVQHLLEGPLQHLMPSINSRETYDGFTWLQKAVQLNDIDFTKKLILWGVDCNAVCTTKRTALFYVSTSEILSVLLEAGARVDVVEVDKHGRSLSDQWNKTLTAVDVRKLNSTLFKSLKKSGSLDPHAMQGSWMDSLLNSSKSVISDQQKKLKIPEDFTWGKDGLKCSPASWIALNNNTNRSSFQQKKIVLHFAGDPQHMPIGMCEGVSISNLDVLAFLETTLDTQHKRRIGWPDHNVWLEKWMHHHGDMDLSYRLDKMCTLFAHVAVLLQSASYISRPVTHTAFDWYGKMFSGREGAVEPYKSSLLALGATIAKISSAATDDTQKEFAKALQKTWDHPITQKLKELAFVNAQFSHGSFLCLHDLIQDAEKNDTSLKNIVRACAHETAAHSSSYYTRKNMYALTNHANENSIKDFNNIVAQALNVLESKNFGALFEDQEWNTLAKAYQNSGQIREGDTNYAIYAHLKTLMERETITRNLGVVSSTPSVKRKM